MKRNTGLKKWVKMTAIAWISPLEPNVPFYVETSHLI